MKNINNNHNMNKKRIDLAKSIVDGATRSGTPQGQIETANATAVGVIAAITAIRGFPQ